MKKAFFIVSLVVIFAGVLVLLYGGLMLFAARNTLDASNDFYQRRFKMAGISFVFGGALLAVGAVLLICRKRFFR